MFENKKVLILGFARSGYEAAKFLSKRGNQIIINDLKKEQDQEKTKELESLGVTCVFGKHPENLLDSSFDYLIKNPGVPIDHFYVLKARELGIEVINEVEMAYRLLPKGVKLIGITGTNGKTTTTTLIYEMLKRAGKNAHLAGNIGYPLCGFLDKLHDGDIIVMETSCQQLENLEKFNPDVAVMTNLSEAHIDFLKSYDNYKRVKAKIFKNHTAENVAILNIENEDVLNVTKNISSTVRYFSSQKEVNGCYLKEDALYYGAEKIIDTEDVKLIGIHNYENIMAAILTVKEFSVSNGDIIDVLKEFGGVEHRMEYVRELDGVTYYNDSKATNIKSTQIALKSFNQPTIVLLGGMERQQNYFDLKDYMSQVKLVVCYGECSNRLKEVMEELNLSTIKVDSLEEAVKEARQNAEAGDVVLLSPAAASWDQYKCFEDRGDEFKKIVQSF